MSSPRSGFGLGSLLVALVIILALGVGTVYAAIPNGNGTYYACLTKSSGVVRLINYPKVKCATGERFIKWKPAGAGGTGGCPGRAGTQGRPGAQGRTQGPGTGPRRLERHPQQARRLRRWRG